MRRNLDKESARRMQIICRTLMLSRLEASARTSKGISLKLYKVMMTQAMNMNVTRVKTARTCPPSITPDKDISLPICHFYFKFVKFYRTDKSAVPIDSAHGVAKRSAQSGHDGEGAQTQGMILYIELSFRYSFIIEGKFLEMSRPGTQTSRR